MLLTMLSACGLGEPKTFSSRNGDLQVTCPSAWIVYDLHDDADIEVAHGREELYLIVLSEPKLGFLGTLEEHSSETRSALSETLANVQESGPRELTINGQRAIQYTIRARVDGVDVVYLHTTIETDENYHQVVAWTLKSLFSKKEGVLQEVIASVEEIGDAEAVEEDVEDEEAEEDGEDGEGEEVE